MPTLSVAKRAWRASTCKTKTPVFSRTLVEHPKPKPYILDVDFNGWTRIIHIESYHFPIGFCPRVSTLYAAAAA